MGALLENKGEGYDIDFFAKDVIGNVIHFASAGSLLPEEIYTYGGASDEVSAYFDNLPATSQVEIKDNLDICILSLLP